MTDAQDKMKREKDRVVGSAKEAYGDATGDQETELKGKVQKKMADVGEKVDKAKNDVLGKVNETIDKIDKK